MSVHPWSILRDPNNFHDPARFIPERWLPDHPEGRRGDKLDRSLPFSYGPRGCLGRKWVVANIPLFSRDTLGKSILWKAFRGMML